MPVATDWQPIATDVTYTSPTTGEREYSLKWTQYDDDEVAVDLAADLAAEETLVSVDAHLWLLRATSESNDTDADSLLVDAPVVEGTMVRQRVAGLTKDRVYRLFIEFGSPGNHRTVTAVIEVVG